MEYEIPTVPKGMLENILANKALVTTGGIPFSAADWIRNGYNTIPTQVFSSIKLSHVPLVHSSQPGPGNMMGSHTPLPFGNSVSFRDNHRTFMNAVGVGGALGVLPLQKKEEKMNSSKKLETKNKKRARSKGVKVNGPSQKKTKTASCADLTLDNGNVPNAKTPTSRSRKRVPSGVERAEETATRKQRLQGFKKQEEDAEQRGGTSNESSLKDGALHGSPNSGSTGILDIYGLKTMPIDLSNYMADISMNNLLSGSFQTPQFSWPAFKAKQSEDNSSIVKEVSKILQLMPKQNHSRVKNLNMGNSEKAGSKLQPQRLAIGSQCPVPQEEISAMVGSEETHITKFTASSEDSTLPAMRLPLYPLEDFLSRLELPVNESLETLLLQAERESGTKSPDLHSNATKNGSIPPLQHSVPLNAAFKSVSKRDKDSKNGSMWLRGGITKCVNGLFGLDRYIKEYSECEEKDTAHPNKCNTSEATQRTAVIDLNLQSPEQLLESSMADFHNSQSSMAYFHNSPLLLQPMQELPCLSMLNTAFEQRIAEGVDKKLCGRADCSIPMGITEENRNPCSKNANHFEKTPLLSVETVTSETPKIHDFKNDIGIAAKLKAGEESKKVLEQLNFNRDKNSEDQGQELKGLKIQRQLSLDKYTTQVADELQPSPSHSHTLQLNVESSPSPPDYSTAMPSSPGVEAAARLLFDMANSRACDNEVSAYTYQENSQVPLQQEALKDEKFVHRLVDRKTISDVELKRIEVYKDGKIKARTNEKRKAKINGSLLLVGKHCPLGKLKVAEIRPNQFQNGAYVSSSKTLSEQRSKNIAKQDTTEADKASDLRISGRLSSPVKLITGSSHLKTKGTILCSSNQNRGNLQPKSLAGSEPTGVNMHIPDKTSWNLKTVDGNHKVAPSAGQSHQKVSNVGHAKSSRQTLSFTGRKR